MPATSVDSVDRDTHLDQPLARVAGGRQRQSAQGDLA